MRIDSHHHLWRYDAGEFPWIREGMDVLKRDYGPAQLRECLGGAGLDGSVAVQARQTIAETEWLLEQAAACDAIRGVVGWVPLVDPEVEASLERFAGEPRLKGVRHILHDEPDDDYMLREDFNRGVARLRRFGLVYDVLIFSRHLQNTLSFVDRHPDQPFVVDHIAKPVIASDLFDESWARSLRELARRPHVTCKLSGVVTEVRDPDWDLPLIRPYLDAALEAFSPGRMMFGSDWPVCLLRCSYGDWAGGVGTLTESLSAHERDALWGGTAARVYGL